MPIHLLDAALIGPGSRYVQEIQQDLLAVCVEDLANLRFSIILTSRWEASASEDLERRSGLRYELADLRRKYSLKIDYIAMSFGVQSAMAAKEEVERNVSVPLGMDHLLAPCEDDCE
ncbi:MAG TPA: hypothetical protein VGT08_02630 [Terracidiphilus sp.]|nr:hypothetical protein [Terracidiphilus sp.]